MAGATGGAGAGIVPELHSEYHLWADRRSWSDSYRLAEEEKRGLWIRSALTPTDLRVAAGHFSLGDPEASRLGRAVMALHTGLSEKNLSEQVEDVISRQLCIEAVAYVSGEAQKVFTDLLPRWYPGEPARRHGLDLDLKLTLTAPVVGIGAPATACMQTAFAHLNTTALLPQGYDVAVAVGAVVGMVDLTFRGTVRPDQGGGFDLYTARARETCRSLDEAVALGRQHLEALAAEAMQENYVACPLFEFAVNEQKVSAGQAEPLLLQVDLTLRATGRPAVAKGY